MQAHLMEKGTGPVSKAGTSGKMGLGDVVTKILHPIAVATGRTGCGACGRRAKRLNKMIPNLNPFAK